MANLLQKAQCPNPIRENPCKKLIFFQFGFLKPRALVAYLVALIGIETAALSFAAPVSGVWAFAFSPKAGTTSYLQDVTCTSASDCWAVGYYYNDNAQTLIEHWDGTKWAVVPSPNTTATFNPTLRRSVRFSFGLLGRRFLQEHRPLSAEPLSDVDRTLGRGRVGDRRLTERERSR
jgi:hypothetical protein